MAFFTRLFSKQSSNLTAATSKPSRRASTSSDSDSDDEGSTYTAGGRTAPAGTSGHNTISAPSEGLGLCSGRRFGTSDRSAPSAGSRRVGGEIRRSQTYTCSSYASLQASARHSISSCDGTGDDKLRQQYGNLRQMHLGGSAVILEGVDRRTKQPVVVKAYAKAAMTASMREQIEREQATLRAAAGCPGVVRLLDQIDDATNVYLVLENAPGYTLIELMAHSGGRLPEGRCVSEVVAPLLRTLSSIHSLGVVHRELKPEHIMCAAGGVKLLDFAKAGQQRHKCLNCRVGQLEYMAPEVLSKPTAADIFHQVLHQGMSEGELPQYDEKADVWSLGCLVYEALTGQQPFMAESPAELAALHNSLLSNPGPDGLPLLLQHPCISKLAREFLAAILQVEPTQRASASALLQHPWVVRHAPSASAGTHWLASAATNNTSAQAHHQHHQQHHQHQHSRSSPGGPILSRPLHGSSRGDMSVGTGGSPLAADAPTSTSLPEAPSNVNSDESAHSSYSGEAPLVTSSSRGAPVAGPGRVSAWEQDAKLPAAQKQAHAAGQAGTAGSGRHVRISAPAFDVVLGQQAAGGNVDVSVR